MGRGEEGRGGLTVLTVFRLGVRGGWVGRETRVEVG